MGVVAAAAIGTGLVTTQIRTVDIVVQNPAGKREIRFWTFHHTVRGALAQAKIRLFPHDKVSPGLKAQLNGHVIRITRAIPVTVKTAHRIFKDWTTDYRVGAVLSALGIRLGPLDVVQPGLMAALKGPTTVTVWRRQWVKETTTEPIPYPVQHQPDADLASGDSVILQSGANGLLETIKRILLQDGRPIASQVLSVRVADPPRPEIVGYGTAPAVARGGAPVVFARRIPMVATAYWPNPAWSDGYTALGWKAQYGVVAVDPRVIPLGSRVFVPGYGFAVAADTGGAIVGNRIDLCFDSESQALAWGVREVNVYVVQ
ncbi:MAG: G5 domain-containing protein [Firmicutes bacterium]|nr:G5 domain-containing protein [Alicyclobacillaceae bacterium]MCL6497226.1 G5 domain-containing protein [Bacillota bacterium]